MFKPFIIAAAALVLSAPAGVVSAASAHEATPAAPLVRIGALSIERPWTRATPPGGQAAGGYVGIVNAGPDPDRLIGAALAGAGRVEIQEMTMDQGVMKMRAVEGGVEIRPGERVELKPGGYHLMILDLKAPLKAGEAVPGALTFARAGKVEVMFTVAPIGAKGPPGEHSGH